MEYTVRIVIDVPDAKSVKDAAEKAKNEAYERIRDGESLDFEVSEQNGYEYSFND